MMHSFRMRYVVLGLLIYLQNAFCRTCGSEFDDIASKAAIAETVFEGIMDNIFIDGTVVDGAVNISSLSLYNATFEVIKTFKGDLPRHRRQYLRVTVGVFGPENPDQCNTHVDIGSQYIVFLNVSQGSVYTISHFPEPATPQAKRELRKILCDDCVVPPRARVRPTVVSVPEKGQLNLRCRAEGFPPPQIQWYKDDRPLENSQLLRIRNRKESSRLRVRRVRLEDTGLYTCVVYNALERVSQDSMVTVVSELETTTTRRPRTSATPTPADWEETTTTPLPPHNLRLCESQSYCLNGGVCYQVISPTNHWEQFCRCAHNFTGTRCQEKQQDITRHDTGPNSRHYSSLLYVHRRGRRHRRHNWRENTDDTESSVKTSSSEHNAHSRRKRTGAAYYVLYL